LGVGWERLDWEREGARSGKDFPNGCHATLHPHEIKFEIKEEREGGVGKLGLNSNKSF
jgi:hypothetical protein